MRPPARPRRRSTGRASEPAGDDVVPLRPVEPAAGVRPRASATLGARAARETDVDTAPRRAPSRGSTSARVASPPGERERRGRTAALGSRRRGRRGSAAAPGPGAAKPGAVGTAGGFGASGSGASSASHVSGDLARRLAARAAAERRRRRTRAGLIAAVLAAAAGLLWLLFFSPVLAFDADHAVVEGASRYVDEDEVAQVVARREGMPLPRLSTGSLAAEIGALQGVESAEVTRDWPHGLHVRVAPREPVAAALTPGGVALVDKSGVVVAERRSAPEGMPALAMPPAPPADEAAHETMRAVLQVLGSLPQELRSRVGVAGATSPGAVTLTLDSGATVKWGDAQDSELKAAVLEVLVEERPSNSYDVSVPDRPTVA